MAKRSLLTVAATFFGLAVLVVPAHAGGHWECRGTSWIAVGAPAHPRPLRTCGEKSGTPKNEAECLKRHGRWGRAGLFPKPICVLPTADAGRVCADTGECEGLCLADPTPAQRARLSAREAVVLTGRCTRSRPVFGCMYIVTKGVARNRICLD